MARFRANTSSDLKTNLVRVMNWSELQIEPVPRAAYVLLCIYITTVTVLALSANGLFIVTTFRSKNLQQPIHYVLRNLAVADFCSALLGGSVNITTNAKGYFYLGQTFCYLEGFLVGTFGIVNLTSICILSFSRYLVICKPFGTYVPSRKHAKYAMALAWIWALLWNTPQLIFGGYDLEGIGTNCGPVWNTKRVYIRVYLICFMICCFFGTVVTLAICYTKILMTIRETRKASSIRSKNSEKAERDVTKMVVNIMVAFLICWTPYVIVALAAVSNPGMRMNQYAGTIPVYFAKSSTIYNPIIYTMMNGKIRKELFRVFKKNYGGEDMDTSYESNRPRTNYVRGQSSC